MTSKAVPLVLGAVLAATGCSRPAAPPSSPPGDLGRPAPPVGPPPSRGLGAGPTSPSAAPPPATTSATTPAPGGAGYQARGAPLQRGKATYYADSLAGNPTASGEPYDPQQLTAAHRELPFGTVVDVVRDDGRWVRVRVTDRGPFAKGRIIDLSRRAAEAVGMIQAGVVDVTLYVVSRPQR